MDDDELDTKLRSLRAQGRSPSDKYENRTIGMNSRLDTLQAAILLPKLEAFEAFELDAVNQTARQYTKELKDIVTTPLIPEGYLSCWAQYTILLRDEAQRDGLKRHLAMQGIPSMIYYPRGLHQQTAYAGFGLLDSAFPITSSVTRRVLSLPMHPYLEENDIHKVCDAIRDFIGSARG
jgi:UDP-2-acetamido-2-deoxy-ribo-hexuluronate aminotransferase